MAKSLYKAERQAGPSTRTAVIAWADYTAPSGLGMDAATAMRAEDGADRLNAMVRGLPGLTPVSLFCHSYGSVVCGVAARDLPERVSDIAVAGSPGMRVEHASQLRTTARVWAMRDADDWIQDVPHLELGGLGHGADPVADGFGARVLSARDARGTPGTSCPARTACGTSRRSGLAHTRRCRVRTGTTPAWRVCPVRPLPDARRSGDTAVCVGRGRRSSCRIR